MGSSNTNLFTDLSKKHSLKHLVLYHYDISNKNPSTKVRFVYLLKGRPNEDGIIIKFKGKFLVPGCFIIPKSKEKEMDEILKLWKIKHKKMPLLTH
jgi:hypothetical protein